MTPGLGDRQEGEGWGGINSIRQAIHTPSCQSANRAQQYIYVHIAGCICIYECEVI